MRLRAFPPVIAVAKWRPLPVWALAVLCVALGLGGDAARELGRYDRAAVLAGEYWRLVTGHLVHLGWSHLWLNVAALIVLGSLFGDTLRRRDWVASGLAAAAAIDVGLFLLEPTIGWYVGLSGVLHGFMAAGAARLVIQGDVFGTVLALGLVGKLVYEQVAGPLPFTASSTGGPVVVAAHLFGAIGGVVATLGLEIERRVSRL